jgi:hypothetical protein
MWILVTTVVFIVLGSLLCNKLSADLNGDRFAIMCNAVFDLSILIWSYGARTLNAGRRHRSRQRSRAPRGQSARPREGTRQPSSQGAAAQQSPNLIFRLWTNIRGFNAPLPRLLKWSTPNPANSQSEDQLTTNGLSHQPDTTGMRLDLLNSSLQWQSIPESDEDV